MLRRIGLQNFKSWRELDIELAPITLLFGANSSGKSAILQSLLMLKQTVNSRGPQVYLDFGGHRNDYADLGSYHDLVFGHDTNKCLSLSLAWNERIQSRQTTGSRAPRFVSFESARFNVTWATDDDLHISKLRYDVRSANSAHDWVEVIRLPDQKYHLRTSLTETDEEFKPVSPPPNFYVLPRLPREIGDSSIAYLGFNRYARWFENLFDRIQYVGPLRRPPNRHYLWTGSKPKVITPDGDNTIQMLIGSARKDCDLLNLVTMRLKNLQLIDSFDVRAIDQNERLYEATATIGGMRASLMDVGFGISQVLPVITMLLSAPEGSIVLLEQPELHLHPNAQAALADLMLQAAETRNLQLIVESHSEHILRRMQRRIAEAESSFATPEKVKAFFCQPGENGSTACEVELDRFGQIANWPDKFLGDISGDIHSMSRAAFKRLKQERAGD